MRIQYSPKTLSPFDSARHFIISIMEYYRVNKYENEILLAFNYKNEVQYLSGGKPNIHILIHLYTYSYT